MRLVLAGFVDLRAPLRVRDALGGQMRAFDPAFVGSSCREFRRPHLRANVRLLERCAHGARGRALLRQLAARRVALPCDMDLAPVEHACRAFLARGEPPPGTAGVLDEPAWRLFFRRVLEREPPLPAGAANGPSVDRTRSRRVLEVE